MEYINLTGIFLMSIVLIPNIIYLFKNRQLENKCSKTIIILENILRYSCFIMMCFNIGFIQKGFTSEKNELLWIMISFMLVALYCITWYTYYIKQSLVKFLLLAIFPSILFIESSLLLQNYVFLVISIIFSILHIYVSYINYKKES